MSYIDRQEICQAAAAQDTAVSETQRLQALREYRILDTAPEIGFDRITRIAASHYGTPIALVSLVDESRQWFKSRVGLDVCQTPREISFCTRAIESEQTTIVTDAARHPVFADSPLVTGPPHIRFYAGCPLTASTGARLGTLCIIDRKPRPDIDRSGTAVLESLAALVVDEMDLRLARERAEAESRAKSDFIATMSHELRTPMTAVMGYVELLGETALDDHQRECVRYVRQSGNHLLQLLNDALDLSKIEAGRLVLRPERFFPAELVRQAAEVFAEMSRSKGLELRIDEVPPAASSFHADHTRIRQILFNLLSNAIKFTNEGEVSVSCAIAANSDGIDTLHLAVRDTGIGVPEGVHAILFDRFVQGDGRDTREQYGAGLGLAICRELSNAMGGSIAVEGRSEGGSCFRVAIPMATDDAGTNC